MTTRKQRIVLTKEQREEIINSTLSNKELTKLYNSNEKTISNIRTAAGKGLGNAGKTGGVNNSKLNPTQMRRVLENIERVVDLSKEFGVTPECIYKIRHKHGLGVKKTKALEKKPPKKKKTINAAETKFEQENKERAKAVKLAEDYKQTTDWKLKNGWAWQKGDMRSMVLRKIN